MTDMTYNFMCAVVHEITHWVLGQGQCKIMSLQYESIEYDRDKRGARRRWVSSWFSGFFNSLVGVVCVT